MSHDHPQDPRPARDPNAPIFDPTNLLGISAANKGQGQGPTSHSPNTTQSHSPAVDAAGLSSLSGLPTGTLDNPDWDANDALDSFVTERTLNQDETIREYSRRVIRENMPLVTKSMVHLALHSKSERTRLDAGKYLMDRDLGKVGDNPGDINPLENFLAEITEFANEHSEEGQGD